MVLAIALLFLLVGVRLYLDRRRATAIQMFASVMGFTLGGQDQNAIAPLVRNFALFQRGHTRAVKNLIYGDIGDATVYIFDYAYTAGSGRRTNTIWQTVVLFHCPSLTLPDFSLAPQYCPYEAIEQLGYCDVAFIGFPKFSKRYRLQTNNDVQIGQTFTPRILNFYQSQQQIYTEGSGAQLVYYQLGKRVNAAQWQSLLDSAQQVYRLFAS